MPQMWMERHFPIGRQELWDFLYEAGEEESESMARLTNINMFMSKVSQYGMEGEICLTMLTVILCV